MPPLRIAILECDTPLDATRAQYGSYGGVFSALLHAGATQLSPSPSLDLSYHDVVTAMDYPSLSGLDAVLLSGSRFDSFANDAWILKLVDFVKGVLDEGKVRVIGVCFGHQIVGRALGAKVDRSEGGWEVSVTPMGLSEEGKKIFGLDRDMELHQMHRDAVFEYPTGAVPLAASPACKVQGFYIKDKAITVQGHPEFTGEIVSEILKMRSAAGIFPEGVYEDGMERVQKKHDGVLVAKAFLNFVING